MYQLDLCATVRCRRRSLYTLLIVALLLLAGNNKAQAATLVVPKGGDLQAALNQAQSGDLILLDAGAIYTGNFVLPVKSGTALITIQSAGQLPSGRITPASSSLLAKLQAPNSDTVIKASPGAHHYQFIGIEVSTTLASIAGHTLIELGDSSQTTLAAVPHDIIFDRCWIHGFTTQEVQRGIGLNGSKIAITNCYISDIHGAGYDTQAIAGWAGPGPFQIINNYLEAAGENVMFGGADPKITNLVPSDIEIRNNTFKKPMSWKVGDPSYAGIHWSVKNLLELKNARNVTIDSNTFDNNWVDAQAGWAIQFTVRNQEGTAPWSILENVSFTNNVVRNSPQGINLLGLDNSQPSQRATGLNIANNLILNISSHFFTMQGYYNVTLRHNTHFQSGNIMSLYGEPSLGFVANDNLTVRVDSGYGIKGDNTGEGTIALTTFTPGFGFQKNLIVSANAAYYPMGNSYPTQVSDVGFVDYANGNYQLLSTSSFHNAATDGKDIGVDFNLLPAGWQTGDPAVIPTPTPTPVPSPSPTATSIASPSPTPTPTPSPSPSPSPAPKLGKKLGQTKHNGQQLSNQLADLSPSGATADDSLLQSSSSSLSDIALFVSDTEDTHSVFWAERQIYPAAAKIDLELTDAVVYAKQANQSALGGHLAATRKQLRQAINQLALAEVAVSPGDIPNPIDVSSYLIRQHYVDFLDREPDQSGNDFWVAQIDDCGSDRNCVEVKRINASAAFFLSIEFRQTGFLVYRLYKSSYGRLPALQEFLPDHSALAAGVVVGTDGWEAKLAANTESFLQAWVQRPEFQSRYSGLTNVQYVDALIANTQRSLTDTERNDLLQDLDNGLSRATVLGKIAENQEFSRREFNSAFVLMQYFGYLGRDPDKTGFDFWLLKLNQFNGNFVKAEMVKAFLGSTEYRRRFGQ